MNEQVIATQNVSANIISMMSESVVGRGVFDANCFEIIKGYEPKYHALKANLREKGLHFEDYLAIEKLIAEIPLRKVWEAKAHNKLCTAGMNFLLDKFFGTSAYTQVGPYLGLISSTGYTNVPVIGDTGASHATWTEAGASTNYPTFTSANRATPSWAAAANNAIAASAAVSFTVDATHNGTIKGAILVLGTGATAAMGNTGGYLFSAGLFQGGDQVLGVNNVVNVSYSFAITSG